MIELIKKEIHMNRQRGTAVSQLTLDDDFIVPDALDDAVQILLSDGEVQIENSRIQGEKVLIRGKLVFRVLYRRESGGLQAMGGRSHLRKRSMCRSFRSATIRRSYGISKI